MPHFLGEEEGLENLVAVVVCLDELGDIDEIAACAQPPMRFPPRMTRLSSMLPMRERGTVSLRSFRLEKLKVLIVALVIASAFSARRFSSWLSQPNLFQEEDDEYPEHGKRRQILDELAPGETGFSAGGTAPDSGAAASGIVPASVLSFGNEAPQ